MSKSKKHKTPIPRDDLRPAPDDRGSPVPGDDLRLDPEHRLVPSFDSTSIKKFRAPEKDEMGVRVLDNCAEEHQM